MNDLRARLEASLVNTYRLERELGSGGMAVVWLAQDLRHHRRVAIKVLRPELAAAVGSERFLREIETLANLTHPHILPLHDSGVADGLPYYVMPYVEGESLRDRLMRESQLPLEDALRITREVADALGHAHARGVVHRDIKPENILLSGGHAVVADFGIAAAIAVAGGSRLTETGIAIGTPAYMSPEQALGERPIDARSDIYALGCVLYEMLAGETPFSGPTPQAALARRLQEPLPSLRVIRDSVPETVERAITKALSRTPADRFVTTDEFARAMLATAASPTSRTVLPKRGTLWVALTTAAVACTVVFGFFVWPDRPNAMSRVVVLPCQQVPASAENEIVAFGIADQVITQLTRTRTLRAVPLNAVLNSAEQQRDYARIADEFGVGAILDCTVISTGGRVRITAHLINARSLEQMWAQPYSTVMDSIMAFQSEIAVRIADALEAKLSTSERRQIERRPTTDREAWLDYARGRFLIDPTEIALEKAIFHFRRAIQRDSTFAQAHAALADALTQRGFLGLRPPRESRDSAKAAAERALALDPELGEAHAAMGWVEFWFEWNWKRAEEELQRAIELTPSAASAHRNYASFLVAMGRFDEAINAARECLALDPNNPASHRELGWVLFMARRYDDAIAQFEKTLEQFPGHGRIALAWSLAASRKHSEAAAHADLILPTLKEDPWILASLAFIYARAGRRLDTERILARLQDLQKRRYVDPRNFAVIYGALGHIDTALDKLEESYRLGSPAMVFLNVEARGLFHGPLRNDPRYVALVEKMRFPPVQSLSRRTTP